MHQTLFNKENQEEMRNFFITVLSPLGYEKKLQKNSEINLPSKSSICIVTNGRIKVSLYSSKGYNKLMFFLIPGEIFGELYHFEQEDLNLIIHTKEDSTISVVDGAIVDEFLNLNPQYYKYFMHSISRKYIISLCQMSDTLFHSSSSRIASTLHRLSLLNSHKVNDDHVISFTLTHQEIADLVGCSRITVTKTLNKFKSQNILTMKNKTITIYNLTALETIAFTE
ncbi:MAG: Crp/Fnr family transcriptional regulator [Clostridium sp.]